MIVQTAPAGEPHFVIRQIDHAHTAGTLAVHFGNQDFTPLTPRDLIEDIIRYHDHGWEAVDAAPALDPRTGLPYHLGQTPMASLVQTNAASPAFNEARHPFAGLISSMHTRGFYNGRYGLEADTYKDFLPSEHHSTIDALSQSEEVRQERLKAALRTDPDTAHWADEAFIMTAYKALRFFDSLALYFHITHPTQHTPAVFTHVPQSANAETDVSLHLTPLGEGRYSLSPWPFALKEIEVTTEGRYLLPLAAGETANMTERLYTQPIAAQSYRLVPVEGEEISVSIT